MTTPSLSLATDIGMLKYNHLPAACSWDPLSVFFWDQIGSLGPWLRVCDDDVARL